MTITAEQARALVNRLRRAEGSDLLPKVLLGLKNAEVTCLEAADMIEILSARIEALEAALTFYADRGEDGYDVTVTDYGLSTDNGHIIKDGGQIARAALNGETK